MIKKMMLPISILFIMLNFLCVSHAESAKKHEVWNNGINSGVSPMLWYEIDNIDPTLYINIKDISKLGLCVEDIDDGIIISNNTPIISLQSMTFNFAHNIYTLQIKNSSYNEADNVNIYSAYYSNDGTIPDLKTHNIYNLQSKDEMTTFMPISNLFGSCAKCKLMIWNDKMQPIGEVTTIKEYSYDRNMAVPENKEMISSIQTIKLL